MTSGALRLSFAIPVKNGARHLERLLRSIATSAAAAGISYEVVVGDNGSTDDTAGVARALGATVVSVPVGWASAVRNAAARQARGELLAFVDADHELDRDWCADALAQFADATIAAVGAQCYAPAEGTWVQRTYDRFRRRDGVPHDVEWLPSGNLVVRRATFHSLGGFDERLQTCEDVDFSHRVLRAGGRLIELPGLRSTHFGDPETLRALFLGELWRGRDNWRVTVAGPLTPRALLSILLPLATLVAVAAMAAGLAAAGFIGWWLAALGLSVVTLLVIVRALPLLLQAGRRPAVAEAAQTVIVSGVYNLARAFALVAPAGHQLRRRA